MTEHEDRKDVESGRPFVGFLLGEMFPEERLDDV